MSNPAPVFPASSPIPFDLFVSKKHPGLPRGVLGFADSLGNIIFKVSRRSSESSSKVLLDSEGNPIISIHHNQDGSWQGFKGNGSVEKDLIFKVRRTRNKFTRTVLEVFLAGENGEDPQATCDFVIKGSVFQRSCTIYGADSIVAQTSLMYKLHQVYARRNKFRLTIFPGDIDHALIAALVVIFLDGRK